MLRHRFRDFVQLDAELRRMLKSRDPALLEKMPTLPEKKVSFKCFVALPVHIILVQRLIDDVLK